MYDNKVVLTIYRRHRAGCVHFEDRISKRCRCPLWATGTLEGKAFRKTLKTRSFERAQQILYVIENSVRDEKPVERVTIISAVNKFITDCEARNLNRSTLAKYKLLGKRLKDFAASRALLHVEELNVEQLRDFRGTWKGSPGTLAKAVERLRALGKFIVETGWLSQNPARSIKAPLVRTNPRLPFTDKEVGSITALAENDRELAFILVLRHTGLRIGDASLLRTTQFSDNRIHLRTTKAGVPVSVVVPPNLVSLLKTIQLRGGYYFLRGESVAMHTTADLWRRRIKAICKRAKVTPDHPHRFRHTLAADLLSKGASVEDVAAILGNSPAVVQKHYSQWIKSRQDRLDEVVAQTWEKQLKLVKN